MRTLTLTLPRALPHQHRVLRSPATRKVWRAGRRTGKSVAARLAAIRGHGPRLSSGKRALRGMLDGGVIIWVTKTYKQSLVVWRKLLRAFAPLEGTLVRIDRQERRVEMLTGTGVLSVWTGHTRDALDTIRGDGIDGAICDECAYFDLAYALQEVLEPALLDRPGCWLFLISTPNAGWDKNEERVTPSYFNRLCADILAGKATGWEQWHNASEDNPKLDAEALKALRERLGPDSVTAQQELDASLVAGGLLALRIDRDALLVDARPLPAHWRIYGSFDWGYSHPWVFCLWCVNEDGVTTLVDSATGRKQTPREIADSVAAMLKRWRVSLKQLPYTAAGHDCWHDRGRASGEQTPTFAEKVIASHGWALKRANIARVAGLNNIRDHLAQRRVRIARTDANLAVLQCLETRISDPDAPEDVLKQDATLDGHGGDDAYDAFRYGLAERMLAAPTLPVPRPREKAAPLGEMLRQTPKDAVPAGWRPVPAQSSTGAVKTPTFRPQVVKR